jgi:uncharacterized protein (DUF885 family)
VIWRVRGLTAALAAASLFSQAHAAELVAGGGAATAALASCDTDLKLLNPLSGWQARWPAEAAAATTAPDQASALAVWREAPTLLERDVVQLRAGLEKGLAAPAPVARRVLSQVDAMLETPVAPKTSDPQWRTLLDGPLRQAVTAYRDFLRDEYIPRAPQGSLLSATPQGQACYASAVRNWTGLELPPSQIEARGRDLMNRARLRLAALAGVQPDKVASVLDDLRSGRDARPVEREDILKVSQAAMERAGAALPAWFEGPSPPPIVIEPIPAALEASLPAGFYRPAEGPKPAAYMINLSRPGERALMAEAIAFHETLPGHHLGLTSARSAGQFNAGFIEGWGVYAEHLADEMGLYSDDRAKIGSAAKDLWGASRLIIEPGLHVHGWSRDQAVEWMTANTALSRSEAEVEVDRYLAMPGQSLAYMLGYSEIRAARDRAREKAGERFDIRAFHKALLEPGSRPLSDLRREF